MEIFIAFFNSKYCIHHLLLKSVGIIPHTYTHTSTTSFQNSVLFIAILNATKTWQALAGWEVIMQVCYNTEQILVSVYICLKQNNTAISPTVKTGQYINILCLLNYIIVLLFVYLALNMSGRIEEEQTYEEICHILKAVFLFYFSTFVRSVLLIRIQHTVYYKPPLQV